MAKQRKNKKAEEAKYIKEINQGRAEESERNEGVTWVLEFITSVKTPEEDPLRTWLVYILLNSKKSWERLEEHLTERWSEGIFQEYWTLKEAKEELAQLVRGLKHSRMTGRDSTTIPGMGPITNPVMERFFNKQLARMQKRLSAELVATDRDLRKYSNPMPAQGDS